MSSPRTFALIGGIPSSGSTLLSTLLDGHQEIVCGPESSLFCHPSAWSAGPAALAPILDGELPADSVPWARPSLDALRYLGHTLEGATQLATTSETWDAFIEALFGGLPEFAEARVLADKTPQNLFGIAAALAVQPDARALLTVRDPAGCIASLSRRGIDPHLAASIWAVDAGQVVTLLGRAELRDRLHLVRYEDLTHKPAEVLDGVCQFLGVRPEAQAMLERRHSRRAQDDATLDPSGAVVGSWQHDPLGEIVVATDLILDDGPATLLRDCAVNIDPAEEAPEEGPIQPITAVADALEYSLPAGSASVQTPIGLVTEAPPNAHAAWYLGKLQIRLAPALTSRIKLRALLFAHVIQRVGFRVMIAGLVMLARLMRGALALTARVVVRGAWLFERLQERLAPPVPRGFHRLTRPPAWVAHRTAPVLRDCANFVMRVAQNRRLDWPANGVRRVRSRLAVPLADQIEALRRTHGWLVLDHSLTPLPEGDWDATVVIAFHGRHRVLELILAELLQPSADGQRIGVVLSCSTATDVEFANQMRARFTNVGVVVGANNPVGRKWQRGVDCARLRPTRYLLITGSDDVMSRDFVVNNTALMDDEAAGTVVLSGPRTWYIADLSRWQPETAESWLWKVSYSSNHHAMPLGAGRIYSAQFLDSVDWLIFQTDWDRLLDDRGFNLVRDQDGYIYNTTLDDGFILSVKGKWAAMNPVEAILSAESINAIEVGAAESADLQSRLGERWGQMLRLADL